GWQRESITLRRHRAPFVSSLSLSSHGKLSPASFVIFLERRALASATLAGGAGDRGDHLEKGGNYARQPSIPPGFLAAVRRGGARRSAGRRGRRLSVAVAQPGRGHHALGPQLLRHP